MRRFGSYRIDDWSRENPAKQAAAARMRFSLTSEGRNFLEPDFGIITGVMGSRMGEKASQPGH